MYDIPHNKIFSIAHHQDRQGQDANKVWSNHLGLFNKRIQINIEN